MNLNELEAIVPALEKKPSLGKNVERGMWVVFIFLFFVFLWSIFATLESASVADGHFIVQGERKTIQNLEGGIIKGIYVQEGQLVTAGASIVTLDDTQTKAKELMVKGQLHTFLASKARILAELSNNERVDFPEEIKKDIKHDVNLQNIAKGQQDLFVANINTYNGQANILKQRIYQFQMQIGSMNAQVKSKSDQLALINEEKEAVAYLEERKLVNKPRLLGLMREAARLMGDKDETLGLIAKAEQGIGEAKAQIYELNEQRRKTLLEELRDDEKNIAELTQQLYAIEDVHKRQVVTAPKAGIVLNLSTHTIGGVVTPGQTICEIVPNHDAMLLQVRIKPLDIDVVRPGLQVKIRLTAYKQRSTPTFLGAVKHLDADAILDTKTNEYYYKSYVDFLPAEKKKLQKFKIYPGMPAQAMIITNNMSPLSYVLSPIKESFNKAFRDD